jgi:hypothetical protein
VGQKCITISTVTFIPNCFVAYPANPLDLAETTEEATALINKGGIVKATSWRTLSVGGNFIISEICRAIDDCHLFIANLTSLNHNVLFETGYAIAKKKRTWFILDPEYKQSHLLFQRFQILTTVGYCRYTNAKHIVDGFYREAPYNTLSNTLYRATIESVLKVTDKQRLLYLKSATETEASVRLSNLVSRSSLPVIVDDPNEVNAQTLSWYAQECHNAFALLAHLLSPYYENYALHNAKCALVAGLAYGMGKPILMLVQAPFPTPIDYRDLARVHTMATECVSIAKDWLTQTEHRYADFLTVKRDYPAMVVAQNALQELNLGEPVAEQEADTLGDYFLETAAYNEALRSRYSVFVGRKGTGKTANLQKLAEFIGSNRLNHVCVIKPVAYELQGIARMLRQCIDVAEQGYLIESLWKYLIYTELCKTCFEVLQRREGLGNLKAEETELLEYVRSNEDIILPDFTVRLEQIVMRLQGLDTTSAPTEQRVKISELLHGGVIKELRGIVGKVLHEKERVAILIDNLDKAWSPISGDLDILATLFLGLLGVSNQISQEFIKADFWRQPVRLYLTVFLRSDIFYQVLRRAREPDKVPNTRILWDDPELLLRIIEERFYRSGKSLDRPEEIWSKYFSPSVNGKKTREYLVETILPRPRDLIFLVKGALNNAINRGHTRIEEGDIIAAEKRYSQFALESLLVESSHRVQQLEGLLYEFAGSPATITYSELVSAMMNATLPSELASEIIDVLIDGAFFGLEVEPDRFVYLYHDDEKRKMLVMARKTLGQRSSEEQRFRINKPFRAYLELKE